MNYLNDIVSALVHLESINLIIRDLTLPNCLLFDEKIVKISDYAKYEDRFASRYVKQMPIRWLPGDIVTGVNYFFFPIVEFCMMKNLGRRLVNSNEYIYVWKSCLRVISFGFIDSL